MEINSFSSKLATEGIFRESEANLRSVMQELYETLAATEEARRRSSFLLSVASLIPPGLTRKMTLVRAARLAVPMLSDWCIVDLLEESDSPEVFSRVEVAYSNPNDAEIAAQVRQRSGSKRSQDFLLKNLRDGEPKLVRKDVSATKPEELESIEIVNEHIFPLQAHAVALFPLIAGGKKAGVLTFAMTRSESRFSRKELVFAGDFTDRIALAAENSRLYEDSLHALNARDEFLSMAAHELKNPVNALKLQFELLRDVIQASSVEHQGSAWVPGKILGPKLDRIAQTLTRTEETVDLLLDVTRMRVGKVDLACSPLDLGQQIGESVSRLMPAFQKAETSLKLDLPRGIYGLWDRFRIGQVVDNLLINAIKYAPGGMVEVRLEKRGSWARFSVKDQGSGIPKADHFRIFERFERVDAMQKSHGMGLGLYIVKNIISAHAGKVWVESEPGQGACFYVELPVEE